MADFLSGSGAEARLILSDLDGCLISGRVILPGVPELLDRAGDRLWVVSNNSSDTAETLCQRLTAMGLHIPADRILLAGEFAVRQLARQAAGQDVALFAAPPLVRLARQLGLRPNRGEWPVARALLARDPAFSLTDLERLMRLIHTGTSLLLANPDPIHPAADGTPVPETGALFAALRAGLPGLAADSAGKPSDAMIRLALARTGVLPKDAVFLGDTDATDGAAARAANVPFVLLRRPGAVQPGEQK